mmetsp:Transcript_519/g.1347  ORF Transcript_519/g.1347 Transcript_519/m.1347 type:complete len:1259 (-) Transcript_519:180-3956(-)
MRSQTLLVALCLSAGGPAAVWGSGCSLTVPFSTTKSHMMMTGEVLGMTMGIDVPDTPPGPPIAGNVTLYLVDYTQCPDWKSVHDVQGLFDGLRFWANITVVQAYPEFILKAASVAIQVHEVVAHVKTDVMTHTNDGGFSGRGTQKVVGGYGIALHKEHTMEGDVYSDVELSGHISACRELPNIQVEVHSFGATKPSEMPGKKSHVDYTFDIVAQNMAKSGSGGAVIEGVEPTFVSWNTSTVLEVTGYSLFGPDGRAATINLFNSEQKTTKECVVIPAPVEKKKSNSNSDDSIDPSLGKLEKLYCMAPPGIPGEALTLLLGEGANCGFEPVSIQYTESDCGPGHAACLRLDHAFFDVDECTCECERGFTGSQCNMCDARSSSACTTVETCLGGHFEFLDLDMSTKTYECTPADLPDPFKAVAVSIRCSPIDRSCELQVGGDAMGFSGEPIVCSAYDCDFRDGAAVAQCAGVLCDMGEYKHVLKAIIGHESISGSCAFTCQPPDKFGLARCILEVSDMPIPITADCHVAECVNAATFNAVTAFRRAWLLSHWASIGLAFGIVIAIPIFLILTLRTPKTLSEVRREIEELELGPRKDTLGNRKDTNILFHRRDTLPPNGADADGQKGAAAGAPAADGLKSATQGPVNRLRFETMTVTAANGRAILNNVSGSALAGETLGVMGPSGSGKTSLLDVLAGVIPEGSEPKGQIYLDDTQLALGDTYPPSLVAYCQQSDLLPSTMSVLECVTFAALLTLPEKMDRHEKLLRATEAIDELGLSHVADSIVGDPTGTGTKARVSGGERRRISLAMSIVARPAILLCDEVTSGLDSTTAMMMIRTLRALSRRGRIVLLTIHQPSSRAFMGLDRLLLLRSGELVLSTPVHNLSTVCVASGFPCEAGVNMADHLLDVIQDPAQAARITEQSDWHDAETGHDVTSPGGPSFDSRRGAGRDWGATIRRAKLELGVLYWRSGLAVLRHPSLFRLHLIVAIGSALVVGILFHGLGHDVSGLQNRIGAVFFVLALFGFSGLSAMEVFMGEMALSLREMRAGYYGLGTILFTKLSVDALLLRIVPAFAFAAIFYPLVNFDKTLEAFSVFLLITVLVNVAAGTLVAALSIPFDSLGSANLCATILMLVLLLLNGALLNLSSAPPAIALCQKLSFFRFGFEAMLGNELHDKVVMVEAPGVDPFPLSANLFLSLLGIDPTQLHVDIIMLAVFSVVHCLGAGLLLKWKTMRKTVPSVRELVDRCVPTSDEPRGKGSFVPMA